MLTFTRLLLFSLLTLLIVPITQAQTTFKAYLSGSHEPELVATMATGSIEARLDGNDLVVSGMFDNLSTPVAVEIAGGLHIHMALPGTNGGVVIVLNATLDADMLGGMLTEANNRFTLTSDQKMALLNGKLYVNIHSEMYPGGELRGQLLDAEATQYRAILTGSNQPNQVLTDAFGLITVEVTDHDAIFKGSFSNLGSALAEEIAGGVHVHIGYAGQEGEVSIVLNATVSDDGLSADFFGEDNTFELTHMQLVALTQRRLYINVHSADYQAGEIRGQILPMADAVFTARLFGATEPGSVITDATGMVIAELRGSKLVLSGSFSGLTSGVATEIAGGVHIHSAPAGSEGGVVFVVNNTLSNMNMSGVFTSSQNNLDINADQIAMLFERGLYVNVHTANFPGGEIRGQLVPEANATYFTRLEGFNERDADGPVRTEAWGAVIVERRKSEITLSGSFAGLGSNLATEIAGGVHIHEAMVDGTGPVRFIVDTMIGDDNRSGMFHASVNTFELESSVATALNMGKLYVNVHSQEYMAGEIRGHLLRESVFFPEETMIIAPANNATVSISGDPLTPFIPRWNIASEASGNAVAYLWELATDMNFESPLLIVNAGVQHSVDLTFGDVADLLLENGVMPGGQITVYHRVWTGNGAVNRPGPASAVTLQLGMGTNLTELEDLPSTFELEQNYPNPFNPSTEIRFQVPASQQVSLEVHNLLGQRVAVLVNATLQAGSYNFSFDASNLGSGIYFYTLKASNQVMTKKMTLIK